MRYIATTFVAICATAFAGSAFASETEVGGIYYDFDSDTKTAVVTYKGKCQCSGDAYQGVLNIPSSVSYEGADYKVVAIGDYAFSNTRKLNEVVIPTSVQSIGFCAFVGSGIESVKFAQPSSVATIGRQAFLACKKLRSIEIPTSVKSIGGYAFEICEALTDVTFAEPSQITVIEEYAFCRTALASLALPANVQTIGHVAFAQCPNMTEVAIPASVTSISELNPFCYNTQVTAMSVEEGNAVYDSRQDCNAIIETATNTLVAGCKTTVIPASVVSIGRSSFNHCTDLKEVVLPATLRSIGKYAYLGCKDLTSFYFPSTMTVMADSVFWKVPSLDSLVSMAQKPFVIDESDFEPAVYDNATLYVPAGTKSLYRSAPVWANFRNIVELDRFVVDGISYQVTAEGEAMVVDASEGVPYNGTIVVPAQVKSGTQLFSVSGVDSNVGSGSENLRVVRRDKMQGPANVSIIGGKGVIRISGSDAEARVYDAGGVMMTATKSRSIRMEQGVYVVECDGTTAKVAVD